MSEAHITRDTTYFGRSFARRESACVLATLADFHFLVMLFRGGILAAI